MQRPPTQAEWIQISEAETIPPREGRAVQVGALNVALFNMGDRFLALENRCPHQGGPLAEGMMGGTTVTCPVHGWRVCLETGLVTKPCVEGTPQVRTFSVQVRDGLVMLNLASSKVAA